MLMREFVDSLHRADVLQLISDYEEFEKYGSIGDCCLRRTAETLITSLTKGTFPGSPILWMERLAFEAYRRIAMEVISGKD